LSAIKDLKSKIMAEEHVTVVLVLSFRSRDNQGVAIAPGKWTKFLSSPLLAAKMNQGPPSPAFPFTYPN